MVGQHDLVIGSTSKALRAMVLAAQRPGDVATATLLGSSELVKQARNRGSLGQRCWDMREVRFYGKGLAMLSRCEWMT